MPVVCRLQSMRLDLKLIETTVTASAVFSVIFQGFRRAIFVMNKIVEKSIQFWGSQAMFKLLSAKKVLNNEVFSGPIWCWIADAYNLNFL